MDNMATIYVLENNFNKKKYIGQTINLKKRMQAHSQPSQNTLIIDRAVNKYGWNNFKQYIYYVPEFLLDYFEIKMIQRSKTLAPLGYNIEIGGNKNKHLSEITCKKISESLKGNKHPNYGKFDEQTSAWKKDKIGRRATQKREIRIAKREMTDDNYKEFLYKRKLNTSKKLSELNKGEKHCNWKGDNVSSKVMRARKRRNKFIIKETI